MTHRHGDQRDHSAAIMAVVTHPWEMWQALDAFEKHLHAQPTVPPLINLAAIHYQFEAIHPIVDGNGRVGRLLVILLMVEWGLLPGPILISPRKWNHAFSSTTTRCSPSQLRVTGLAGRSCSWRSLKFRRVMHWVAPTCSLRVSCQQRLKDAVCRETSASAIVRIPPSLSAQHSPRGQAARTLVLDIAPISWRCDTNRFRDDRTSAAGLARDLRWSSLRL